MPYCAKCGVELEENARACPLCGTKTNLEPTSGESDASLAVETVEEAGQAKGAHHGKFFAVEVMSVIAGIAAILCLAVDLWTTGGKLDWSLYVLDGLAMAYILAAMPVLFLKKPWILFAILAPSELLLLFLIDVIDGAGSWFPTMGLPIYMLSLGLMIGALVLIMISKVRGLNVLGIILAAASLECLGLEAILSLNLTKSLALFWSPVVAIACLPASGLAFYFHYRVIKKPLRRSFHL